MYSFLLCFDVVRPLVHFDFWVRLEDLSDHTSQLHSVIHSSYNQTSGGPASLHKDSGRIIIRTYTQ
jgi:hypothetical protein